MLESIQHSTTALPTGIITFLFTDVEGSTRLWEQHPDVMWQAMARHDELIEANVTRGSGAVVRPRGEGDSRFAVFTRARDAVGAARDIQRALSMEIWTTPRPLHVRMALHTGEADLRAGDYYGSDVNRCARLRAIASGGQTLLSQATFDLVRDAVPDDVTLLDLGEHRLKDLQRPERVYQVAIAGLKNEFPALQSVDTFPNNLPIQLTTFVGRERELTETKQLLTTTRLLTLTGSGGTGKTRLSLQLAAESLDSFADGVWFVELAPVTDPGLVLQTVATALGVRELPGHSIQELLIGHLRAKHLLLVLDNCEHLIDACARLADKLLRTCPNLKILTSSREALGIAGEHAYRVPSLSIGELRQAPALNTVMRNDCVRLFVERALAAQASFHLTDKNALAIAQICARLDGIPLAVELAAARVKVFAPDQIAARLDDRFRLLTGGSRTALPRQQTLRALIDWSYDLLPEAERTLLRRLSVFAGGWTFEAAEAVCAGNAIETFDILDLLTHLVDKSLVTVDDSQDASARYRLLETIRQYARDKLLDSGEAVAVRDRHLNYFLQFGNEAWAFALSVRQVEWQRRVKSEEDNVRAAIEWGLDHQPEAALSLSGEVCLYWSRIGHASEGCRWLRAGLERVTALAPVEGVAARERQFNQARALLGMASSLITLGEMAVAKQYADKSLPIWHELGMKREEGYALIVIGISTQFLGDAPTALATVKAGIAIARQVGDPWQLAYILGVGAMIIGTLENDLETARSYLEESTGIFRALSDDQNAAFPLLVLGDLEYISGNFEQARAAFEPSLTGFLAAGNPPEANRARSGLANAEWRLGHYDAAMNLYRQVLAVWQQIGQRGGIARCLECVAFMFLHQAEKESAREEWFRRAARLLGAAQKIRETIHASMMPSEEIEYNQEVARLREQLDEASLKAGWAEGRALSMDQAIAAIAV